jgi:tetratricopeptide (TPR) repeat protein
MRVGEISLEKLGDADEAEIRFQSVFGLDPEHLGALTALQSIYESQGRGSDLITICERKAALAIEVFERIDLYRKIAVAAENEGDLNKAESSWRWVLKLDSADSDSLIALEKIYRERGDFGELAQVLDRRAELADDVETMAQIKLEKGRVCEEKLRDLRGAADAYEEALEVTPNAPEIMDKLEQIYGELGDSRELSRLIEHRVRNAPDAEVRRDALLQLAGIEEQLGRPDHAIEKYESVVQLDPTHAGALEKLIALYESRENWEAACRTLEQVISVTASVEKQDEYRVHAAQIYELELKDLDKAAGLAESILEHEPEHQQAMWLKARVSESQHDDADAISTYVALVATLGDGKEKMATLMSLGRLYLDNEGNTSKALACFRDALAIDAGNVKARALLKQVLYKRESWEALLPVLERELESAQSPQERAELCFELAVLCRDSLERGDEALKWLQQGYEARRSHRRIVEALIDYHSSREDWSEVMPLLGWLVSYLESKRHHEELAKRAFSLGQLYEQLDEQDKALRYYKVVNKYDSRNVVNLLAMGRLFFDAEDYEKALQTLQGLLLLQHDISDDKLRVDMFWYLARVCSAMGDNKKSRRHLQRLLDIKPDHRPARELLDS